MTKKKVTAPLTYNPGKGRPKEHLAYLNYQEMQALKRLNGNNMERGPKGLPSFPPSGTTGKSSSSTGARGPTGPQGQARTSPAGSAGGKAGSVSRTATSASKPSATQSSRSSGPSSSLNAPSRTAPSASISRPSDTGGRSTTSRIGSAASAQRSISRPSDTVGQKGSASVSRISGGTPGGNQKDAQFRAAAESRSISKAANTPAFKNDVGRSAIGGISRDRSAGLVDPSKIKGAIKGVQETAAEAALRRRGPIGPAPQQYKTIEDFNRAFARELAEKQFARTGYSPQDINRLAQGVYGEAAAEGYRGMNPVSRSMVNSIAGGIEVPSYSYLGGSDADKLARRYTVFQDPNKPFKAAGIGSLNQTQGLFSLAQASSPISPFSQAADISDRIKNATHYYAQDTVKPNWADKSFERYGEHTFGTADAVSEKRIAAAREKIFGEPSYSTTGPVITPTSSTPERRATPGLIQYPRLDRPTPPTAAQEAARLRGLMESYQQPPGYGKEIVDRIAPEYRPYDIRIPPKDQRVITKPELSPRSAEEVSPLLKSFSERVPQEGTLEEGRLMGDLIAQDIFRKNNLAEIEAQSPSYGRLGAVDERMLYNPSEATTERMRQVFDRSRGMSYTPGLPAPMPSAPIPRPRPDVQGPPRPIRGMSFTGMPDQMFVGAEVPYRPYDITPQEPSYRPYDIRVTSPPAPIMDVSYDTGVEGKYQDRILPQSKYAGYGNFTRPLTPQEIAKKQREKFPVILGPKNVTAPSPASMPYDVRLGKMEVAVPMKGADGETVNGIATIDSYVKSVPGLNDAEKSALRRSMIGDASSGTLDFTTADIKRKIAEAKTEVVSEAPQYNRAETQESVSPFGPRSYDSPYPTDENGVPIQNVSESDLAKIRARRRGEEYAPTPQERNAIRAGKIVTNVITGRIPGLNKIINTEEKMKDFYSRPSWEQEYIAQRASDWAAIRGERPVTKAEAEEIKQRTGRNVPRKPGGISGLGGGRDQTYEKIVSEIPESSAPETPSTPSTPSGRRPDIYYMWDLGVNIPSPSDPNYTQYQTYLAERLAAQRAMGYV